MQKTIKIGQNKNNSRLWIEGNTLPKFKFNPEQRYHLNFYTEVPCIILTRAHDGSRKVSSRTRKSTGKVTPIIDLCDGVLTAFLNKHFPGDTECIVSFEQGIITFNRVEV
jgi:hypothetical protein